MVEHEGHMIVLRYASREFPLDFLAEQMNFADETDHARHHVSVKTYRWADGLHWIAREDTFTFTYSN